MTIIDFNGDYSDYLHDESRWEGRASAICFPTCGNEVVQALETAVKNRWSVTIQGGRTGVTGGCVPNGGLILNLSRMNAVGPIEGKLMKVQSGALLSDIRNAVSEAGTPALFFPSDLTETTASIGGMVANNASGARSFKYGAVRNWIHALEVVLPNGDVVTLVRGIHKSDGLHFKVGRIEGELPDISHSRRCETVKSAAGYFVKPDMDLVDLFVGAEGTLGVITEITIKLLPKPEQMNGLTAFFASEQHALEFVQFLRGTDPAGASAVPVAIEIFDFQSLELLRRMKKEHPAFSGLPELKVEYHTALYFEYDSEVPDDVINCCDDAVDCWFSEGESEVSVLKKFRHAIPESVNMLIGERKQTIPELTKLGTDMSVPNHRLEDVMQLYHSGLADAGLEYVIFGHIGDNHVHVNILPRNMEEYETGQKLYLSWAAQVVEWGGSVSAEHGIGKLKTEFFKLMVSNAGSAEMNRLKKLVDPCVLLNLGNLFSY